MSGELAKTPLHPWHAAHGGRMVDFAGWSMPVQYGSIVDEHLACRTHAALFDVSHMGRLFLQGPREVEQALDRLLTRKILGMPVGKVRYSLVCNEQGGILDDVLVYRLVDRDSAPQFMIVVNSSNRQKIVDWLAQHLPTDAPVVDRSTELAMIALQGPASLKLLAPLASQRLDDLGYYASLECRVDDHPALVSRTGYTGEDGFELIVPSAAATGIWSRLAAEGARPAGLGARDTLRLEAAMPLYGHELNETVDPYQAGLDFAVNLAGREFIGRAALEQRKNDPQRPVRVGLALSGRRVPRERFGIYSGDENVGEVTSGTFSPTLGRPIAMAYVRPESARTGNTLTVDIRGTRETCEATPLPFYKRTNSPTQ
jgi:aminomethyltransferase